MASFRRTGVMSMSQWQEFTLASRGNLAGSKKAGSSGTTKPLFKELPTFIILDGWMDGWHCKGHYMGTYKWAHDMTSDMNACFMVYISEYLKLRLCITNFFMAMNPMAGQFLCSYSMTMEPSQNSKISRRHFSSCVSKLNKT